MVVKIKWGERKHIITIPDDGKHLINVPDVIKLRVISYNELRSNLKEDALEQADWVGLNSPRCDHSKTQGISTLIGFNFLTGAIFGKPLLSVKVTQQESTPQEDTCFKVSRLLQRPCRHLRRLGGRAALLYSQVTSSPGLLPTEAAGREAVVPLHEAHSSTEKPPRPCQVGRCASTWRLPSASALATTCLLISAWERKRPQRPARAWQRAGF